MRDKIKSNDYFLERIKIIDSIIEDSMEYLQTEELSERKILRNKFHIFEYRYQRLFALYSKGESINEVENELILLLNLIPEFWGLNIGKAKVRKEGILDEYLLNPYQMALELMALGVLLRNRFVLSKLRYLINRDNIKDALYDYFLSNGKLDSVKPPYIFDKKMSRIKDVHKNLRATLFTQNKIEQTQLIEEYLNNGFHKENGPAYETHKSSMVIYNGYWSFESGAISVLLDVDTETLRKSDYFPTDLVDNYKLKKNKS